MIALLAGCGDDQGSGGTGSDAGVTIRVAAAASLTEGFEAYADEAFAEAEVAYSFAGSDELAAQIRQGAPVDVFASADTELPRALAEEGLLSEPVELVTNELVLGVPAGSEIDSLGDLTEPGVDVVLGAPDVPFGSYAREVLDRLAAAERRAILANVRSEESDVKAAVAKLAQGAADASLVYSSDVAAASGEIEGIQLPAELRPDVVYGIGVVAEAPEPELAQAFVEGLLVEEGQRILIDAGFKPPPGG